MVAVSVCLFGIRIRIRINIAIGLGVCVSISISTSMHQCICIMVLAAVAVVSSSPNLSSSLSRSRSHSRSTSTSASSRRPPPHQPPLLPTLLRARSFYSVFTVRSSCHTTSSCLKIHSATLINSASDLGGWGGGEGGGWGGRGVDDDIGTQTPPNNISTRAVLLVIYSTFVMADPLI